MRLFVVAQPHVGTSDLALNLYPRVTIRTLTQFAHLCYNSHLYVLPLHTLINFVHCFFYITFHQAYFPN